MIDLHTHILPGMDDGAKTPDEALRMVELAAGAGTTAIVLTPHVIEGSWLPAWKKIVDSFHSLQQAVERKGIAVTLHPGAEVALNFDLLEQLREPGPYCLNGGRYILLELPALEVPVFTDDFFFTLQRRGFLPILAHPERHPRLARHAELLLEWVRRGILLQIDSSSLTGRMGRSVRDFTELLLRNQLVHCMGSDAHGLQDRQPVLTEAAARLTDLIGRDAAQRILVENPRQILSSEALAFPEISTLRKRRRLWFFR
jgi:protein-tyrosine phosphatase